VRSPSPPPRPRQPWRLPASPRQAPARLRRTRPNRHDPNELTADQIAAQEKSLSTALASRQKLSAPSAQLAATITIPVVVFVIQRDSTRAGGNIPDSMITQQISVLNNSYDGGSVGGRRPRSRSASSPSPT
jgi:hypothetical protein